MFFCLFVCFFFVCFLFVFAYECYVLFNGLLYLVGPVWQCDLLAGEDRAACFAVHCLVTYAGFSLTLILAVCTLKLCSRLSKNRGKGPE